MQDCPSVSIGRRREKLERSQRQRSGGVEVGPGADFAPLSSEGAQGRTPWEAKGGPLQGKAEGRAVSRRRTEAGPCKTGEREARLD